MAQQKQEQNQKQKQSRRLIVQLMEAQLEKNLFAWLNSENSGMSKKSASYITGVGLLQISDIWRL